MQMPAQFFIHVWDELRNLLLCDRWAEVDIPDRKAGKSRGIAWKQTMKEGGAASQISQNEEWFFDRLCFVPGEEEIIQKETEPMHEWPNGPDKIKKEEECNSFACKTGWRVFWGEKRKIRCSPEEFEVVNH